MGRLASCKKQGFTLIELSIVLVIIGLIIGGILIGQELIGQAGARAQVAQIEKYNSAVNTFSTKYGCLPGDCATAATFGFPAAGPFAGEGDGNGVVEGNWNNTSGNNSGITVLAGETATFWVDLSMAGLVDGGFTMASNTSQAIWVADLTLSSWQCSGCNEIAKMLPQARIGQGNYIYIRSLNGVNYFVVSAVNDIEFNGGQLGSTPGFTVSQAYNIDKKIDDGLPNTGKVTTEFENLGLMWETFAAGYPYWDTVGMTSAVALPQTGSSCFDNGNNASTPYKYSLGTSANNGSGLNCALSFKMQGAAR